MNGPNGMALGKVAFQHLPKPLQIRAFLHGEPTPRGLFRAPSPPLLHRDRPRQINHRQHFPAVQFGAEREQGIAVLVGGNPMVDGRYRLVDHLLDAVCLPEASHAAMISTARDVIIASLLTMPP